jgi:hypothetical protein
VGGLQQKINVLWSRDHRSGAVPCELSTRTRKGGQCGAGAFACRTCAVFHKGSFRNKTQSTSLSPKRVKLRRMKAEFYIKSVYTGMAVMIIASAAGCRSSPLKVKDTDCLLTDAVVTATALESESQGKRSVLISAKGTCRGDKPLKGATLSVDRPAAGPDDGLLLKTDALGNAQIQEPTGIDSLVGHALYVTVQAEDGVFRTAGGSTSYSISIEKR